jgi:O-antigen ligase
MMARVRALLTAWPRPDGAVLASVLLGLLVFAEIMLFGANSTDLALAFGGLWLLSLAMLLVGPRARRAVEQARLGWISLSFAAVLAVGLFSLTPVAVGGPHPIWRWVAGASSPASIVPYLTLVELLKLAALGAAFMIGAIIGQEDDRAKALIRWLLWLGLVYSLWAFAGRVLDPVLLFGGPRPFDPNRLSASLVSANSAATLFGALTLLNLVDLDRRVQFHSRGGRFNVRHIERLVSEIARPLIGLVAAATCLVLTFSRAGLGATAAIGVILIAGAVLARTGRGVLSAPILAILAILGGVTLAVLATNLEVFQDRLSFVDRDAATRATVYAAHWSAFRAASASGYGLGAFGRVNATLMNPSNVGVLGVLGAAHNVYLQWLEQAGVVDAAAMFACIGLIAIRISLGAMRRRRMRSWLVGILAVLALFLIHGVTDFAFEVPALATLLSLFLGLGCGVSGGQLDT